MHLIHARQRAAVRREPIDSRKVHAGAAAGRHREHRMHAVTDWSPPRSQRAEPAALARAGFRNGPPWQRKEQAATAPVATLSVRGIQRRWSFSAVSPRGIRRLPDADHAGYGPLRKDGNRSSVIVKRVWGGEENPGQLAWSERRFVKSARYLPVRGGVRTRQPMQRSTSDEGEKACSWSSISWR